MNSIQNFRADAMALEHAPLLIEMMNDAAALRVAREVLEAMERLIDGLTQRSILAHLAVESGGDRGAAMTALYGLAACVGEAEAALRSDAKHVSDVLRDDATDRGALNGVAGDRLRVAEAMGKALRLDLDGFDARQQAERESLCAAGLSEAEKAAVLVARAASEGERLGLLRRRVAGWDAEAACLREFFGDPLRDRARLGILAEFLACEVASNRSDGWVRDARWRAAGPLALSSKQY